uniref:Uncharacterized protein n=1 Tax=uncultured marine virus TaxID=186617 RepID=A0A0F7L4C3_9VIRU|nr:hypothetical protein [uncultured marine virus]
MALNFAKVIALIFNLVFNDFFLLAIIRCLRFFQTVHPSLSHTFCYPTPSK